MADVYPISLRIAGKRCLVVGGGRVAERKVRALLEAGGAVRVVAPEATPEVARLAEKGLIEWRQAPAAEADIAEAFLVIVATNDSDLNARLAAAADAAGKLVNVVDQPEACNFFVPAAVRRGPLVISVSTGGASPALAKRIRQELESRFGPEYGELAELMGRLRPGAYRCATTQHTRARCWERILDSPVFRLLQQGRRDEAEALARSLLQDQPDDEANPEGGTRR